MLAAKAISCFAFKKISNGDVILVYGWYGPDPMTEKLEEGTAPLPFSSELAGCRFVTSVPESSSPFTPAHLWYPEFFRRLGLMTGGFGW